MKTKRLLSLVMIMAIVSLSVYTAFFGLGSETTGIMSVSEGMKLGLDIQGGVVLEYEAQTDLEGDALRAELEGTAAVMRVRIDSKGLMEPKVTVMHETKRIRVEMPGVTDVNEAASFIGSTAKLSFHKVAEGADVSRLAIENGVLAVSDFEQVEIMDGNSIKNALAEFIQSDNYIGYAVSLEMDKVGAEAFKAATTEFVNRDSRMGRIAIAVDGKVISAPVATSVIGTGTCIITNMEQQDAVNLALQIKSGALPLDLKEIKSSLIGPTLGQDALESSINAAKVGFILVVLFMLFFYRVPGLIASVALVLFATIILYSMVFLNATLTLPGVAGIVLSLGMAVDANVVIFERLKEELKNGKTIRASVKSGFKRAMTTIVDANITTLIAAIVLYYFGEGPLRGFATTLGIGIIASLFTAVVFTRSLLVNIDGIGIIKNRKFFGA